MSTTGKEQRKKVGHWQILAWNHVKDGKEKIQKIRISMKISMDIKKRTASKVTLDHAMSTISMRRRQNLAYTNAKKVWNNYVNLA